MNAKVALALTIFFALILVLSPAIRARMYINQYGGFDPSRGSKCFSCEAQDAAMGIDRDYGTKCVDCEVQDRRNGIHRGYGSKWF
jgi:hypothetical protein